MRFQEYFCLRREVIWLMKRECSVYRKQKNVQVWDEINRPREHLHLRLERRQDIKKVVRLFKPPVNAKNKRDEWIRDFEWELTFESCNMW